MTLALIVLTGCASTESSSNAALLNIDVQDNYTKVEVSDPWNLGELLDTYILVPKNKELPDNLPQGTIIRTPLEKTIVYSGVHGNAISKLGKIDAIAAVAEGNYFTSPAMVQALKEGKIKDIGSSMQPSTELIMALQPEAILLSPYQNAGTGIVGELGIPIIQMADYMESSPLQRAEWIKFLGLLYGAPKKAEAMYQQSEKRYNELKDMVSQAGQKPKVITEQVIDGVWYVPGGASYQAHMLRDAGADYPWQDDENSGSLQLDFASVYDRAHDATVWLMRNDCDITLCSLKDNYSMNTEMDAFKNKGVWNANTLSTTLFDDFPFQPDTLLRDYIIIFHPELNLGQPVYYKHIED